MMAEYTGLEPTDTFADESNILDQIDFNTDEIELTEDFCSFFEPSGPQDSEPGPVKQEESHEVLQSLSQCIDPKLLSNDYEPTADIAVEQHGLENYGTNYPIANPMTNLMNGNVVYNVPYPPASNLVPTMNFPQNAFQYQYLPATNPPYLGHGAGSPVYFMQYPPPPEQAYPTADATYVLPEALRSNAHPATHLVSKNDSQLQDPPPARISASFDSSVVDPKIFQARRSRIPSPIIIYRNPPLKRPPKGPNGEPLKNDRIPRVTRKNQPRPDPREWYGPPLSPPESWGPKDKTGRPVFRYTEYGELERGRSYSQKEMRWYLYGPKLHEDFELPKPLPNVPEVENKSRQGLTIWIGWVASQSNERYPHASQSQRCRFADCPDPNHTIRAGFPRVIFDERTNVDGEAIDPFYNAGYAHLFCFEKHFDLVQAFVHLDVRADERSFKREENLGRLSRQFPEIRNELDIWWREQFPKFMKYGKNRDRSYKQSLSYRLICHTLDHSSEGRVKMRENRAGADMSKHKGDLIELRFLKDCIAEGLVDDNGDPLPGARELLAELNAKGRRRKMGFLKRIGTPRFPIPAGLHMGMSPQSAQSGSYHGFTPGADFIPMPQLSPVNFPAPHDGMSTAATNFNQTIAVGSMYQPGPDSPMHPPKKRDLDEVLSEDQQGSNNQAWGQESSNKRRRLSRPTSPRPDPSANQNPLPHDSWQQPQIEEPNRSPTEGEECSGLLIDLSHHDEAELNDDDVFNLIDDAMPNGEYSTGGNVNKAAETEIDGSFGQELGEDDDLFGEPDDADYKAGDAEQHFSHEENPGLDD